MGLLDKLWDDVFAGPQPDKGLSRLRHDENEVRKRVLERRRSADFLQSQEEARRITQSIAITKPPPLSMDNLDIKDASSLSSTPTGLTPPASPSLASPSGKVRENVWRSVFHPGSNKAMQKIGSAKFDKPDPQSPTSVYDWLYSGETKSKWR